MEALPMGKIRRDFLRGELRRLALCAAAAAAALLAVSALCALPASRRKLMQSPKKRGR